ncbi:hypothetical protein PR048_005502 [Dryococelus australis]|uniref:Uncharacterized protein n=1 Tax=Dryococelus australis TaxID=614101 RepID=A0ABQ9I8I5_9NEOP|nr:hypothetical protein PR048_005502 [Dryococelus australis]
MLLTGQCFSRFRDITAIIAIQAGEVDDVGVSVIAVVTDGAWSRSYGTNYNVLSGYYFVSLVYRHVSVVLKQRRFYLQIQETHTVAFVIGHHLKFPCVLQELEQIV